MSRSSSPSSGGTVASFVLVPGGWQGGWAYADVASNLAARGHRAEALTLSGLGDVSAPSANLDTHIDEVLRAVEAHSDPVILVGHSYAGLVITGAADAAPSRVQALVYVDAYVPESGDSLWSLTTPSFREMFVEGAKADGRSCTPPPGRDPRFRSQPIGTVFQSIRLGGSWRSVPTKVYVVARGWEGSPFRGVYDRLASDPEWETFAMSCGHNVARLEPAALTEILLAQVTRPPRA